MSEETFEGYTKEVDLGITNVKFEGTMVKVHEFKQMIWCYKCKKYIDTHSHFREEHEGLPNKAD